MPAIRDTTTPEVWTRVLSVLRGLSQAMPWLERISGAILILLAVMVMARLTVRSMAVG